MRLQRLSRILSKSRYDRCRQLFRSPLRSHLALAGMGKGPFVLEFTNGETLTCPSYAIVRHMWQFLFSDVMAGVPVSCSDGMVRFPYEGSELFLRPNKADYFIFNEIYVDDVYGIQALPESLGTVIDLGGNVGMFASRIAPLAERIVVVEPVPSNIDVMRRNVQGTGCPEKFEILQMAGGGESGQTLEIHLSVMPGLHSAFADLAHRVGSAGMVRAETISLQDLFGRYGIDRCGMLKCDVEGGEYDILLNTPKEILQRVDRIAMEVHTGPSIPFRVPELFALLEDCGFNYEFIEGEMPTDGTEALAATIHGVRSSPTPVTSDARGNPAGMSRGD